MMISRSTPEHAYVWVWLPGEVHPVVAGRLQRYGDTLLFNYGKSYLERVEAISIYDAELPLKPGLLPLLSGLNMPGCIRDASPDAWGRRVILNRLMGAKGYSADTATVDELTYLLVSGSDRVGALDFQLSASTYEARSSVSATFEMLLDSIGCIEKGDLLPPELGLALFHGSSIGGARPKALIDRDGRKYVAKFSSSTDLYDVVKAEFVAMRLAAAVGLNVAPVELHNLPRKDVLLVERFDRQRVGDGWARRAVVSALTLMGLDEMMARYASYQTLAEIIRYRFFDPAKTLRELFGRVVFNVLCGNNDDHARNHAAFWDGQALTLTPAYDICPQPRTGGVATQAMAIVGDERLSSMATCLMAAPQFLLRANEAIDIIEHQLRTVGEHWESICEQARLGTAERAWLWGRQFLNAYAFDGLSGEPARIKHLADDIRHRYAAIKP